MRVPLCVLMVTGMCKHKDSNGDKTAPADSILIYNLFIGIQSVIGLYTTICIRENAKAHFKAI